MALRIDFKNELQGFVFFCLFFFYDKHLSVDSTENIMSIECPHFIFPVLKHSGLSVNRDKTQTRQLGVAGLGNEYFAVEERSSNFG